MILSGPYGLGDSQLNHAPRCRLITLTLGFSAQPLCSFVAAHLARRCSSPLVLATLARRSCLRCVLAVLARRSCSRWILQRLRWSRSQQALHPTFVSRARQLRLVPGIFPASLVSSPASSPALSSASCMVAQPRLPPRSSARAVSSPPLHRNFQVIHRAPLPPPSPWLRLPASTAAPFYCIQLHP